MNLFIFTSWATSFLYFPPPNLCNRGNWTPAKEYTVWGTESFHIFHNHTDRPEKDFVVMYWSFFCCWQRDTNNSSIWSKSWWNRNSCFVFCCFIFQDSVSYKTRNNSLKRSWMTQDSVAPRAKKKDREFFILSPFICLSFSLPYFFLEACGFKYVLACSVRNQYEESAANVRHRVIQVQEWLSETRGREDGSFQLCFSLDLSIYANYSLVLPFFFSYTVP